MAGKPQQSKTAEDIILDEGFGLASIVQGIQELANDATDAIFPVEAFGSDIGCLSNDEDISITSTACSITDASTATGSGKSVSWFDDEMNNCSVEVQLADMKNSSQLKNKLKKNLSLSVLSSGKRTSRRKKSHN